MLLFIKSMMIVCYMNWQNFIDRHWVLAVGTEHLVQADNSWEPAQINLDRYSHRHIILLVYNKSMAMGTVYVLIYILVANYYYIFHGISLNLLKPL